MTISEPQFKDADGYLTNPTWVGGAMPPGAMGWPWGLGGEYWFVTAQRDTPRRQRRTFAGTDKDTVTAAAQAWVECTCAPGYAVCDVCRASYYPPREG